MFGVVLNWFLRPRKPHNVLRLCLLLFKWESFRNPWERESSCDSRWKMGGLKQWPYVNFKLEETQIWCKGFFEEWWSQPCYHALREASGFFRSEENLCGTLLVMTTVIFAGLCCVLLLGTADGLKEWTMEDVVSLFQHSRQFWDEWMMFLTDLQSFKSHICLQLVPPALQSSLFEVHTLFFLVQ